MTKHAHSRFLPEVDPDARVVTKEAVFERASFNECHAPTLVETGEGDLLVAFFAGTREGSEDVSIWTSRRKGVSWTAPEKAACLEGVACWNPVLFRDEHGTTYLFYKVGHSPETWTGVYLASEDEGRSWSEPHYLPAGLTGPTKNKPITMSNGDVICGASTESHESWACWAEVIRNQQWLRYGPICYGGVSKGVIQPSIVELSGGRLRMFMRSTRAIGKVCAAASPDYGRTWSTARSTVLPNPNSGIDAVKLGSGVIVMAYNDSATERTPLSVATSVDEGLTWQKALDLEVEEGEFSYPSVIQTRDGLVHLVYTWKRKRIEHAVLQV